MESKELLRIHPSLRNTLSLIIWPILLIPVGLYLLRTYVWETMAVKWMVLYAAVLLLIPLYAWIKKHVFTYVVSNRTVMSRQGILRRYSTEVRIADIRRISVRQGLLQRIMGIGEVGFSSAAGDDEEVTFHGVRHPENIKQLVQKQMRELDMVEGEETD